MPRGRALFERWERRRQTEWIVFDLLDQIEPVFYVSYLHAAPATRRWIKQLILAVGAGAAAVLLALGQFVHAIVGGVLALSLLLTFLGHDFYLAVQRWRDGGRFRRGR